MTQSKLTESLLHKDWKYISFESVCKKLLNGGTPPTNVKTFWSGNIPWITGADFNNDNIDEVRRWITKEAIEKSSTNVVEQGNLLVVTRTGVGKLAIAPFDVAISQDITGVSFNELADAKFMFFSLKNSIEYLSRLNQGTSINGIKREDLLNHKIVLPPLKVQKYVSKILTTISDLINQTEAIIEKYQSIKQGMMQDLLTRGVDENGKLRPPYEEAPHLYKESELGWIPKEWEACQLTTICDLQVGYAFKSSWFEEDEGIPLLRGENVGYGTPDWNDCKRLRESKTQEFKEYILTPGDIVIGMDRTFTKSGFKVSQLREEDCPSLLVQRVGRFLAQSCDRSYMRGLLHWESYQRALRNHEKGMDIPHLSKSEILEPVVPVPPPFEQEYIGRVFTSLDNLIGSQEKTVNKLEFLKCGLMSDLLTGRVNVHIDRTEREPANV